MRSAIFIVAIVTALVSSSVVVKAVSEEQSNLSNVIQDTTVESVAKHMNNNLRGLSTYESDTTNDEERAFGLDKVASALHIGKEAKALKLFQKKASLQKFIDKDISPEVLFKAIGLNHLGTNGKMTYAQFKALRGEDKTRVAHLINADEGLQSKTAMVSRLEWAWHNNT